MTQTDPRRDAARAWAERAAGSPLDQFEPASADASFRRYFRAAAKSDSWIVMDAPPEHEPLDAFVRVAMQLEAWSIPAPKVIAQDPKAGYLLLSDLGGQTMLAALDELPEDMPDPEADAAAAVFYEEALDWLLTMQTERPPASLPDYDAAELRREMDLFECWFLAEHLGVTLDDAQRKHLLAAQDQLIASAAEQPQVFVHRDYHSRNLMVDDDQWTLSGVLDFQDAVLGPITYDAVSLLKDCYICWDDETRAQWLEYWAEQAQDAGLLAADAPLERWFDWMGLQRHLKVLGIFCRLHYRDGKSAYLDDLPMVLDYVRDVLDRYPQLAGLNDVFDHAVWPAIDGGA